jgi:hypothetical protein
MCGVIIGGALTVILYGANPLMTTFMVGISLFTISKW